MARLDPKATREYHRKWREANRERLREASRRNYNPEYHREYYLANKERKRRNATLWSAANPDKTRESARKVRQRRIASGQSAACAFAWECRNREKVLWQKARCRARDGNIPFDIEITDVTIPEKCPILGIPIAPRGGGRMNPNSPSLDRIDPSKGYTKGNVWVISWHANRMKCNATPEELLTFARSVVRIFGK